MAGRKKQVLFDHNCWIVMPTRKSREIFKNDDTLQVFNSNKLQDYLTNVNANLFSVESIDDGTAVLIALSIHPDKAISDIIFNIKRISFNILYRKLAIKEMLNGEKAIWTRDFVCATTKSKALTLYDSFVEKGGGV